MTDLDPDTKARIEAEERYRAEVRAREEVAGPAPTPSPLPAAPAKKGGCGKWFLIGIGVVVALSVLGNLLGGSETPAGTTSSSTSPVASTPQTTPDPPANDGDGQVQSDGSQSVGVWNVSDVSWSTSRSLGGEYGVQADAGETFVIVNYTLKNTTNETQNFSSMIDQPGLVLADGGMIDSDLMLSAYGNGQVLDGQIAPGLKRTGSYGFRVPTERIDGMKFQIQFFNGKRVSFDLGQ